MSLSDSDFLRLLGVRLDDAAAVDAVSDALQEARALGIDAEIVSPIVQAYERAIARVAEAEAEYLSQMCTDLPLEARAERSRALAERLLPVGDKVFPALHRALLRSAVARATPEDGEEVGVESLAIALVDICGSTRYIADSSRTEVQQMVDVLFEAGQTVCHQRPIRAAKYVGDGFFLVGRSSMEVARAAIDAVDLIERHQPLRARAGLAYGPVLRRAGDHFGLPVNLAQALTKAARPGSLLATADAAETLAATSSRVSSEITVKGLDEPIRVVELAGTPGRAQEEPFNRRYAIS